MSKFAEPTNGRQNYVPVLLPEVTPLQGEFGVYLVESRSRPGVQHRVDVLAYGGNGACGCEHFEIKFRGTLERGAKPAYRLKCRHLAVAREVYGIEMAMAYSRMKRNDRKNELEAKAKASGVMAASVQTQNRNHQGNGTGNRISPDI